MSAVFQAVADNGAIIVDSNWPNLVLVKKGTITAPANAGAGGTYGQVAWNNSRGGQSIVFLRANAFAAVIETAPTGFTWFMASGSTSCDYYAFVPVIEPYGNIGLQLFDADGQLTYDAAQRPLRIRQMIRASQSMVWPDSGGIGTIYPFALANPSTAAIAFSDPGMYGQYLSGTPVGSAFWRAPATVCNRINGSNVEIAACQSIANAYPGQGVNISARAGVQPRWLLECDITGL